MRGDDAGGYVPTNRQDGRPPRAGDDAAERDCGSQRDGLRVRGDDRYRDTWSRVQLGRPRVRGDYSSE